MIILRIVPNRLNWLGNRIIWFMKFSFFRKAVWVVCFVCVGSWLFGVGIALCLSFLIPDFVKKVLKFF